MADEETTVLEDRDERFQVDGWRLSQLLRAGYDLPDASMLALRVDVDLHEACELVDRGCPADMAARILL